MRSPIRIALIRQRYTPFGGAERFVESALNALQKEADIELTLITRKWDGADNPNVKKIICDPFYIGRLWRDWSFARCACRTVKSKDFDLVQSHERVPCGDIYRAGDGVHREWLQQRSRIMSWKKKLIIKLSPYHRYLLWQEKRMFEQQTLKTIIVNSSQTGKEIKQHFPRSTSKLKIIYNSVDTSKFNPELNSNAKKQVRQELGIPQDSTVILFIGSGFERKGVYLLLTVLKEMPTSFQLIIVGKDRKLNHFKELSKKYGLTDRVHFTGPQQETVPFYLASDIFAFPTLYDPLPNTVLEAMASGLPVLISDSCGAKELVQNGIEGFIQDALDVNGWKKNILSMIQDDKSKKIGENARQKALSLSPDKLTTNLMNLYREEINLDSAT